MSGVYGQQLHERSPERALVLHHGDRARYITDATITNPFNQCGQARGIRERI
jgi:hypothetical protein